LSLLLTGISLRAGDNLLGALLTPVDPGDLVEAPVPVQSIADVDPSSDETDALIGDLPVYDLISALESALVDRLGLPGRVELTSVGRLPVVNLGSEPLDIALVENPERLSGSGLVLRYEVLRAGELVGEWSGVFRCRHLADVWVPTRRLEAGEVLYPDGFETREVDLIRNSKAVVAERDQFSRYELARAVYPGRPISWTDLTPRTLVRKGELVDVVVREGYLSISMKALAVSTGSLGEVVAVRNLQSKREFPAEVIDEKTVQVSL